MRTEIEKFEIMLNNMVDQVGEEAVLAAVRDVREHGEPEIIKAAEEMFETADLLEHTLLEVLGIIQEQNIVKKALNVMFPKRMDVKVIDPLPLPVKSEEGDNIVALLQQTNSVLTAIMSHIVDNFDQLDLSIDDLTAVTAGTSRADVEAAQAAGRDVVDVKGTSPRNTTKQQPAKEKD